MALRALDDFLAAYEAEHGEVTDEEIRDAARHARGRAVVVRCDREEQGAGRPRRGRGAA